MVDIVLLNSMKFESVENLVNIPLFEISPIDSSIDIKAYDALIFTSKNAIYSLNSFNHEWKTIPSYAIAPKTARVIEEEGGVVKFVGEESHGNEFAKELIPLLKGKKALYIRAKKTVSKLGSILKDSGVELSELITYETTCVKEVNIKLKEGSIIIFSSPSTVECFFKHFDWNESFKAVVIGETTAKYIPKNIKFHTSSQTSLEKCVEVAQNLRS